MEGGRKDGAFLEARAEVGMSDVLTGRSWAREGTVVQWLVWGSG